MERYRPKVVQGQKAGDRYLRLEKPTLVQRLMERLKPNQINHQKNLKLHTGFYHGVFRREGIPQPNVKKLEVKGTIFKWRPQAISRRVFKRK